jgi:uncharacterized protein Yka (UPF0111/DUF47 family)
MLKKSLSSIMGQFHKAKTDLETFIGNQDERVEKIVQKVQDLEHEQDQVQDERNRADKSLTKIKEILGE